jgi:hypothetical protein
LARTTTERPLRRLVGEARELGGVGQLVRFHALDGKELGRLPVAERDRPGLVQEQGGHVTRRLDGPAAHGQHVLLHHPVHPGDADGREQPADGGRDEAHQQRDQHHHVGPLAGVDGERLEADDRDQEDDREHAEQDRQRDLVRGLLPLGPFDQGDHPVHERPARLGGDPDAQVVAEHPRPAGHPRAVPARLPDHRRGLAGDGGLVDGGDALDRLPVAGDDLARPDLDDVAGPQLGAGHGLGAPVLAQPPGHRGGPGLPELVGLRLAAALGHRLGEAGEHDREPEPERDLPGEGDRPPGEQVDQEPDGDQHAAGLDDEQHRVAHLHPRVELAERRPDRGPHDRRIEHIHRRSPTGFRRRRAGRCG